MTTGYTARVPATSANLGPGFDALGLALGLYDEVTASLSGGQSRVSIEGEGAGELLTDESHLIVYAIRETLEELGRKPEGVRLHCVNRIPQARGLGSSSAAIVAGVILGDALCGGGLSRADQLRIAARIEGHPDNVAPCLLGGFTIAWESGGGAKAVSLQAHPAVAPTLFVPVNRGLTAAARAALPKAVPHADAAFNAGRSALLVHALTEDPALLFDATEDRLHQEYRAAGMPGSAELVRRLRGLGVAAVISGAGPTVLTLTAPPSGFEPNDQGAGSWLAHTLQVESGGARVSTSNISPSLGHAE